MDPARDRLVGSDLLRMKGHDLAEDGILKLQPRGCLPDPRQALAGRRHASNRLKHPVDAVQGHQLLKLLVLPLAEGRGRPGLGKLEEHPPKLSGVRCRKNGGPHVFPNDQRPAAHRRESRQRSRGRESRRATAIESMRSWGRRAALLEDKQPGRSMGGRGTGNAGIGEPERLRCCKKGSEIERRSVPNGRSRAGCSGADLVPGARSVTSGP